MTSIVLGYAPGAGAAAVVQCNTFKSLMHEKIGRDPEGAYLHMEHEGERCRMEVALTDASGQQWADAAKDAAAEVWEDAMMPPAIKVKPITLKILARSQGA